MKTKIDLNQNHTINNRNLYHMRKILLLLLIFSCLQIKAQCWKTGAAGYNHTIAVRTDGTLWTWGSNDQGQLGNSTPTTINIPTKIGIANDWKTVAAGWAHTVALKADGSLWAWGYGGLGQIGNGSYTTNFNPPQQIGTSKNWQTIVAGYGHTVALKTDGTLWAWGNNFSGQLGNGTTLDKNIPTQVGTANDWQNVVAGKLHTVALKKDGTLWAWGKNTLGALGDGTTTNSRVPKQIGTATNWKTIAAGSDHTIATKTDGTLWIWGDNTYGALGDGTTTTKNVPTQIGTSTDWKTVDGGVNYTIAIKTDGSLWAWGFNSDGEFGNGTKINSLIPVQIGTESNWQMIDGGSIHTVAMKTDESLWAWGSNSLGQLGDGTSIDKNIPTVLNCLGSLIIKTSQDNITCFGDTNGSASITSVSGGTAPYTYLWSNGKTTSSITGLNAGEYSCTVTDAASLSITKIFTITQPTILNSTVTNTNASCNSNNGSLTVIATGGTPPYLYAISPVFNYQTSNVFAGLSPGIYTVNTTDTKGCITTNSIVVDASNTSPPTANAQSFNTSATIADLKAVGSNLKWFDVPTGGSALGLSTSLQTGKYYVSQTINGCESLRLVVDVTIISAPGNGQIPTNGLIAYYPFNGNANDTSGNGSNGTVTAATLTSDRFGNSNTAYSFDGVNSYIDAVIPNIPQNNSLRTISGWFKTSDAFSDPNKYEVSIFNYGTLAKLQRLSLSIYSKGYLQMISGTNLSTDDFYVNNFDYSNNDWYFFTLTYDGTKLSVYANGKFVSEKAVNLNTVDNIFRIGQRISGDNVKEGFKGTIDDIAIWNRVLTPEEISAMYVPANTNNYTLIPDSNFEQKLINLGIDTDGLNGKVLTYNISTVKFLDLTKSNISDLTGIQDFVSLTDLYCGQNSLTTLNVSKNTALTTLDCNNNRITSLDVSNNIALLNLSCYANQLTALDVKVNTALTKLDSGSNKYTALDVSSNTALTFLGCNTSQLTSLDVSKNTALNLLDCRENKLTHLDVSKITTLTELYCQSNQLTNLDVSKNKALEFLNCAKNQLTTLDVSINTALVGLYSNSNQLTSLNLKNANNVKFAYLSLIGNPNLSCIQVDDVNYSNANWSAKKDAGATFNTLCEAYTLIPDINFEKALIAKGIDTGTTDGMVLTSSIESITELNLYYSNISDLTGIQNFKALTSLNVMSNKLSTVDLSKNLALNYLLINHNDLTTLDISNNTALENLVASNNKLQNIDVSKNLKLKYFTCSSNQLTTIDVSNNKELILLSCQLNQLKSLDLSQNKNLALFTCSENKTLTNVDLRNGNNKNMQIAPYVIDFTKNPSLTCILVDNALYSNENWTNFKEKSASFSTVDCSQITAIPDPAFEDKLIYLQIDTDGKNGTVLNTSISNISTLNIENSNIKNLTGINGFSGLSTLNCSSNLLTALDLSHNKTLTFLDCGSNNLTSLNIKNGNNKNLDLNSNFTKNPDLTCISVDDEVYANQKWAGIKDGVANYNLDCTNYTLIPDSAFEQKLIDLGIDKDGLNGKITTADISTITYLDLSNSNITDLTGIEKFTALTYLDCNSNNIKTIDVSKNKSLTKLALHGNQLTSLDVTANTQLYNLTFSMNQISTIDLSQNKNLHYLIADRNLLSNIDLSANNELEILYCGNNNLTALNLSNLVNLTFLDCGLNNLRQLNLSTNTKLTELFCYNDQLTSLDLSTNVLLKTLNATANQLTTLDLSHNPLLTLVFLELNPLTSLNVQNGNNVNFILPSKTNKKASAALYTSFLKNKSLSCIQVDNVEYSNANWANIKEPNATYSSTCKSLGIEDSVFDKVVVYPNPTKGEININNATLEKATVYNTLGQLVRSFTLSSTNTNHKIDLTGLSKGVYYIYLINQDAASVKKVIVE
ncbi:leucine-rich repeat domain-containing protein [uncultured Flavobacterium sp.]|uniref:RCC1 domain-containing protein n=1 Tax=uncultured Flavobacterium sp. TaxID=165435 RepID=UPI0029307E92|nr:leucine-rich repeat domain-containing protein [uncultured Flavobacterium sp.]